MKAMFDACCTAPSSQVVGTTPQTQSPRQVDLATKPPGSMPQQQQQTTTTDQPTVGQRVAQPVANLLARVEERLPVMAPVAGSMKQMITGAAGTTASPDMD